MSLEARHLDFGFASRIVGRDLAFRLEPRSIACLLGPNGSGKTTLLRTLLGLLAPRGGELLLEDRGLAAWGAAARARHLAYVPQAADSDFDFSAIEMVEMGRSMHRGPFSPPNDEDRRVARDSLERLDIAALAERPVQRLSGGERQLVLVARALATGATYLLLDEPTAHLDFGNQARVLAELRRLADGGHGILFTSHAPEHAFEVADHALLLRAGGMLAAGPVAEVMTAENLSALYGRPVDVLETRDGQGRLRRLCVAR
jgi:iron complex transport system ATP-binding protein